MCMGVAKLTLAMCLDIPVIPYKASARAKLLQLFRWAYMWESQIKAFSQWIETGHGSCLWFLLVPVPSQKQGCVSMLGVTLTCVE